MLKKSTGVGHELEPTASTDSQTRKSGSLILVAFALLLSLIHI